LDEIAMLSQLEALAHALGIQVRYERLEGEKAFPSGGLCRIRNKHFIILNEMATTGEKVRTLASALKRFDLSRIYLRPAIRDFLEGAMGEKE
jgi:hypothetical protein